MDKEASTIKHYVISGGCGFLGSHLTKRLVKDGQQVTVIDNFLTGRRENLGHFKLEDKATLIEHDICQPVTIDAKVDYVCNLACPASPGEYFKVPIETLEINARGTQNMLELARSKQARFFHTSTSEVYGDPTVHPQPETYFGNVEPYCQRSCYDEGKRYAEALIYAYRQKHQLNTGIIRIFNTYGPLMKPHDGRVVSSFIRQALKHEDITIQGTGEQTRSFCYVDDQIEGMMKMIHSDQEGPINIGNPEEFTIKELADLVIGLTDSSSKIVHVPPAPSDPRQRRPDINQAMTKLDWQPTIKLTDGLTRTIAWFREIGYE